MKLLVFIAILTSSFFTAASETIHYDWLTMGKKTGSQVVNYLDQNTVVIDFEFKDRGLGPKLHDKITISNDGIILSETVSGNTYMGAPVNESFSLHNNIARWKNTLEDETQTLDNTSVFYVAANGTPQSLELLIKAVVNSKTQSINLLPSGVATIEQLKTIKVKNADDSKTVSLYAVYGLGYTPEYVWLDADMRLFALGYGSMGMVLSGWASNMPQLQLIQDDINTNLLASKSKKLVNKLGDVTVINNVNIFNSIDSYLHNNKQVVIRDGKIAEINAVAKNIHNAKVINGKGKTLMAGLWDMHTHMTLADGMLNIASGITNARDVGNVYDDLSAMKVAFNSNEVIGPNIYAVGLIDKKEETSAPSGLHAITLQQALQHVDWYADNGFKQVKLYSSIPPEWIKPIAVHAHKRQMKVSGHIPALTSAEFTVNNGFDEIHHMNMVFRNFIVEDDEDYRAAKFTLVGERAGALDLNSKEVNDFILLLKQKGIVVDPTLTIFQSLYLNKPGEIDPSYAAVADHLPANIRRDYLLSAMLDINSENEVQYAKTAEAFLVLTKKMYDAGITLVAGTDSMAGFTLHRELELLALAGIPNAEVLKIATINAARLNNEKKLGAIVIGNDADLILIDGDPLKNISDIRKVALVIKNSTWYQPNALFSAVGVKPFIQ